MDSEGRGERPRAPRGGLGAPRVRPRPCSAPPLPSCPAPPGAAAHVPLALPISAAAPFPPGEPRGASAAQLRTGQDLRWAEACGGSQRNYQLRPLSRSTWSARVPPPRFLAAPREAPACRYASEPRPESAIGFPPSNQTNPRPPGSSRRAAGRAGRPADRMQVFPFALIMLYG